MNNLNNDNSRHSFNASGLQHGGGGNVTKRSPLRLSDKCHEGLHRVYVADLQGFEFVVIRTLIENYRSNIHDIVEQLLYNHKSLKFDIQISILMSRPENDEINHETTKIFNFNSNLRSIYDISLLNFILNTNIEILENQLQSVLDSGSLWNVEFVTKMQLNFFEFEPLGGGGGSTWLDTPPQLLKKQAVVNIRNLEDNMCFVWSIACGLVNKYMGSSKPYMLTNEIRHCAKNRLKLEIWVFQ